MTGYVCAKGKSPRVNTFGTDTLIQAPDARMAALFYVNPLDFEITGESRNSAYASVVCQLPQADD